MKNILFDTNAYIRFVAGDEKIMAEIERVDQISISMSVVVLGELYAGYRGGEKEQQNKIILNKFIETSDVSILGVSQVTADYYGRIKSTLKKTGRPIPSNDIWIAAQALETGSVLVTYDTHFLAVPGLRVWDELRD